MVEVSRPPIRKTSTCATPPSPSLICPRSAAWIYSTLKPLGNGSSLIEPCSSAGWPIRTRGFADAGPRAHCETPSRGGLPINRSVTGPRHCGCECGVTGACGVSERGGRTRAWHLRHGLTALSEDLPRRVAVGTVRHCGGSHLSGSRLAAGNACNRPGVGIGGGRGIRSMLPDSPSTPVRSC